MSIVVVMPAPNAILAPADVRAALGLDGTTAPDAQLTLLIAAAFAEFDGPDGSLRRSLLTATYDFFLDHLPSHRSGFHRQPIDIPLPPLLDATTVQVFYRNGLGTEVVLDPTTYRVVKETPARLFCSQTYWPWRIWSGVRIRYTAGYGADGPSVPAPIRQAIVMRVGQLRSMSRVDPLLKQDTVVGVSSQQWETQADVQAVVDRSITNLVSNYRVRSL